MPRTQRRRGSGPGGAAGWSRSCCSWARSRPSPSAASPPRRARPNRSRGRPVPARLTGTLTFDGYPMLLLGTYIQIKPGQPVAGYDLTVTSATASLTVNLADGSVTGLSEYSDDEVSTSGGVSCNYHVTEKRVIQGNLGGPARSASATSRRLSDHRPGEQGPVPARPEHLSETLHRHLRQDRLAGGDRPDRGQRWGLPPARRVHQHLVLRRLFQRLPGQGPGVPEERDALPHALRFRRLSELALHAGLCPADELPGFERRDGRQTGRPPVA